VFWGLGQNRERGGAISTPNELVLSFGVLTSVPILVKINQENATVRVLADGYTDRQTINRFYNLSIWTDKNKHDLITMMTTTTTINSNTRKFIC